MEIWERLVQGGTEAWWRTPGHICYPSPGSLPKWCFSMAVKTMTERWKSGGWRVGTQVKPGAAGVPFRSACLPISQQCPSSGLPPSDMRIGKAINGGPEYPQCPHIRSWPPRREKYNCSRFYRIIKNISSQLPKLWNMLENVLPYKKPSQSKVMTVIS